MSTLSIIKQYLLESENKPYRKRVEIYCVDNNMILGGNYSDGSFGVYGGGLDNDNIIEAAKREFEEESGYTLLNVKKLPFPSYKIEWNDTHPLLQDKSKNFGKDKELADQIEERRKKYRGSEVIFVSGSLGQKGNKSKGVEGYTSLKNIRFYNLSEIKTMKSNTTDKSLVGVIKIRIKICEYLLK